MCLAASLISPRPFKPRQHSLHRATQAIYNCRCRGCHPDKFPLCRRQQPALPSQLRRRRMSTVFMNGKNLEVQGSLLLTTPWNCQQSILALKHNCVSVSFHQSHKHRRHRHRRSGGGGGGGGGCREASSSSLSRTDVRNDGTHETRVMHPSVRLSS